MECFGLGIPHDGEEITTDPTTGWLRQPLHRVGSNGGINSIATGLENIECHLRGQRLAGGSYAVLRHDF